MNEILIEQMQVAVELPNKYDQSEVLCNYMIANNTSNDWDLLRLTLRLFNSNGCIVKEKIIYERTYIATGSSFNLKTKFESIPTNLIGSEPKATISVTACQLIKFDLGEIQIPSEPNTVIPIDLVKDCDLLKILSASIWKSQPDENQSTLIQAVFLFKNVAQLYIPQIRFNLELVGSDGSYLENAGARQEVNPLETFVVEGRAFVKERMLMKSSAIINLEIYKLLGFNAK